MKESNVTEQLKAKANGLIDQADSKVDSAATAVGERLEQTGTYLKEHSGRDFISDMGEMIKRHPKKSLGIGIGIGFLVARRLAR